MAEIRAEDVGGYDSAILALPIELDPANAPELARDEGYAQVVWNELHGIALEQAANLGEVLLRDFWYVTRDPDEVRTHGLLHDCERCRAGVDTAIEFLRNNPNRSVAVGQLLWARQDRPQDDPQPVENVVDLPPTPG